MLNGRKCSKCGNFRLIGEFVKNTKANLGIGAICKECVRKRSKKYRIDNKDKVKEYRKSTREKNKRYQKKYRGGNKEYFEKYSEKYRKDNHDNLNAKKREYYSSLAHYETHKDGLTREEDPISGENGELLCRCSKCREYFPVTNVQVANRKRALIGGSNGELRLYCSKKCKQQCDVYWSINTPKSLRNQTKQSRCNQSLNKQQLLQSQIDTYNYNFCEKCGNKFSKKYLIIHHNLMVSKNYKEADNMSHQILVCKECHKHEGC